MKLLATLLTTMRNLRTSARTLSAASSSTPLVVARPLARSQQPVASPAAAFASSRPLTRVPTSSFASTAFSRPHLRTMVAAPEAPPAETSASLADNPLLLVSALEAK